MAEKKVVKSFLFGALAGAVTGAVTALLFAPKAGKELRKDIADTAQTVGEKTVELSKKAGTSAQSLVKKSTDWAVDIRSKFGKRAGAEEASADEEAESVAR
ncbi:YtxH domain-containing protein [Cohnella fermenti]|uniref:YtxH domain-containing protein n=1 Tax=Cohnella fermenti TaxID=2565925 RepID=A0A4S4BXJ2_9BACL|nr:YtxH domain-containing protein [Cohnella fermenti]THF79913.1 YtxH domain-containing protein [Cohnella fermenti]